MLFDLGGTNHKACHCRELGFAFSHNLGRLAPDVALMSKRENMFTRAMVFGTLMLGTVGPCFAAKCETEIDQYGMTQCYANALKTTERSLQELIARYRDGLDSKQLTLFDEEQTAWLNYRDSYCKFRSSSTEGGSVHGMIVAICREDLTSARLADIKKLTATCEQGDLTCVGTRSGSERGANE